MEDIFSRLLNITSYINQTLIQFIEDIMLRDVSGWFEDSEIISRVQDLISSVSSVSRCSFLDRASCSIDCDSTTRVGLLERGDTLLEGLPSIDSRLQTVNTSSNYGGLRFIFKGLILPVYFFEFAWRLAVESWRFSCNYMRQMQARANGIISRVLKTLRGSSDDIGWLQHTPGMAPVEDGSVRFQELLQGIRLQFLASLKYLLFRDILSPCQAPRQVLVIIQIPRSGLHKLPDSFVYLLIPGLFSNHGPLYFVSTKRFFSKMGLACHIAKIHSEASVEHNAWELKQYIEELYWGSGKRVLMLGHSKGGVDAAAALSIYSRELRNKVAGLALVQSPYGGTPIASDILREGQIADAETRRIMEFLICKVIKGDIRALEDLTYEKRKEFIKNHKLPNNIPLISFHSEASVAPGVLATMSHIAHAELPWLPRFGMEDAENAAIAARRVPVIVPVSAAMALCALHLQLRYGEKSDGLVTCRDAEVPGSVVVKPGRKFDHSWIVYSSWTNDPTESLDSCEMCEALLTMLVELGSKIQN